MITAQRSAVPARELQPPLTWLPLKDKARLSASFICPNGHDGTLLDHTIAPDGAVSPSVVCPQEGCTFHDSVRLEGWSG